jgi:hypothetical protein
LKCRRSSQTNHGTRKTRQNFSELFNKKFILKKKEVSFRKNIWEGIKIPRMDATTDSLWSMKTVLCALMMLHSLVSRSRNLISCEVPSKLINGTGNLFTIGAISSPPKGNFEVRWHCVANIEKGTPLASG